MLGIIIGVSAVIALMSIGRGAQAQVTAQIQSLGTNLLFIRPGATKDQGVRSSAGNAASLTLDDADAIATLPNVVATAPEVGTGLGNTDDQVYVPITTVMARLFAQRTSRGAPNVSTVNVQVASESVMDETVSEIGDLLRTRHKVAQDDFTIQSQQDFLNTFNQ